MDFPDMFRHLEASVYSAWRNGGESPDHLATAAVDGIKASRELFDLDPMLCLKWLTETENLPSQFDRAIEAFSMTVVSNQDFHIHLHFWELNASFTHRHRTCGAFAALSGRRLHVTYAYEAETPPHNNVTLGRLEPKLVEMMSSGDVRPIQPGLIHDLYWIEKPAVTLTVRCAIHPSRKPELPLYYVEPGIEYLDAPYYRDLVVKKKLAGLRLLRKVNETLYREALAKLLRSDDWSLAFHAAADGIAGSVPSLRKLLTDAASDRQDELMAALLEAVEPLERRQVFENLYARTPEAQLLAALLRARLSTDQLLPLVSREYPDHDPAGLVLASGAELIEISPATRPYVEEALSGVAAG